MNAQRIAYLLHFDIPDPEKVLRAEAKAAIDQAVSEGRVEIDPIDGTWTLTEKGEEYLALASGDEPLEFAGDETEIQCCPSCGHMELSDGYARDDCPNCTIVQMEELIV